ncbi:unnamed protein product [Blepharisma stoltei]|uniref:RGS domain-containing protein n=1 Tax=Blepharisma stoltei TaxID=1481888 RepID=A0AAU9ILX3_9CILI|nr:unnamed protein product [Blepharisma stoltei]
MSNKSFSEEANSINRSHKNPFKLCKNLGCSKLPLEQELCSMHLILEFISKIRSGFKKKYISLSNSNMILKSKFSKILSPKKFREFLASIKISYSVTELREFIKVYGFLHEDGEYKISIEVLEKILSRTAHKKQSARSSERGVKKSNRKHRGIKPSNKSFIISRSFSTEESSKLLDKTNDEEPEYLRDMIGTTDNATNFMQKLLGIFPNLYTAAEYFYYQRAELLFDEFEESSRALGLGSEFLEFDLIFHELRDGEGISKDKFINVLEESQHIDEYDNFCYEELSNNLESNHICPPIFERSLRISPVKFISTLNRKSLNTSIREKEHLKRKYSDQNSFKTKETKALKIIEANYCAIKSCDSFAHKNSCYCSKHLDKLITKARLFISRIKSHLPSPRSEEMVNAFIKDLKKDTNIKNLKNEIECRAPGQLFTDHDIAALQEFLKLPTPKQQFKVKNTDFNECLKELSRPNRKFSPSQGFSPLLGSFRIGYSEIRKNGNTPHLTPKKSSSGNSLSRSPVRRIIRLR